MSELLKLDVSKHVEKKGQLTYLSWSWAWSEVLKIDPAAHWEAIEFNGLPVAYFPDHTAMVKVMVRIKEDSKSCWLPVMDHKNKAIVGPDAMDINKAMMRCLAKAIAMHGLGLYIYSGEDLPESEPVNYLEIIKSSETMADLRQAFAAGWKTATDADRETLKAAYDTRTAFLTKETA